MGPPGTPGKPGQSGAKGMYSGYHLSVESSSHSRFFFLNYHAH